MIRLAAALALAAWAAPSRQSSTGARERAAALDVAKDVLQPELFSERPLDTPGLDRFAAVGDDGTGDEKQQAVHDALGREHARAPFASILKLGDNVYEKGEVELFDGTIRRPLQPLLDAGVRAYPVLGNHDAPTALGESQLRYWGAPRWYRQRLGEHLELFALDTTILLPGIKEGAEGAYDKLKSWAEELGRQELDWLRSALAESSASFKLVFGHHPIYLSSEKPAKQEQAKLLRGILEPLLKAAKVPLYLSGHEHLYERSKPIAGTTHIVSGGGGAPLASGALDSPGHARESLARKHHYMIFEARGRALRFKALTRKGNVLDEGTIEAR